ncbi:MAG: VacB/RNase II family 3'-5' exoribonuclease [Firmicutes bacterium]|nr:VacB/RNase II family 3'-5' exoribonuclease [Bacillota bacterium]
MQYGAEKNIYDLKDELMAYLDNPSQKYKKYKFNQLRAKMCGEKGYRVDMLREALRELELEGLIEVDQSRGLFRSFPHDLGYVHGKISINKHDEGFIMGRDGKKYKIRTEDLNDALDGDTVIVKPTKKMSEGHVVCKVDRIVKRKDGLVVVEVTKGEDGEYYLRPFNARLNHPIKINAMSMRPLVEGDRIVVKISELTDNKCYYAGFVKNIGHKDDPDADLKIIAIENKIVIDFSEAALAEADAIPTEVTEEEKVGRLDLTNELIFSIDGASTKDRDDAVSIKINERGNYVVGVHISDVTHYVHPGMQLWEEALQRGTSVYMADTVIPMLPHKLSNGICSLNPDVDRLTFSCIMEVTPQGEVLNYDFVDTVINSRKAMTYEEVNQIFEDGELPPGYEEFYDALDLMRQLSERMEKVKEKRGYVNFGSNDLEIKMDENGNPVEFKKKQQRTAEKIIENLMLLAGESYANYMIIPSPLRVHEAPDEERVEEAFETLEKSGIRVKSTHDIVNGKVIQQLLSQIEDMDERTVAAQIILRSMSRARYDVENVGHFGLGLPTYGHWTSPIRRAADLRGHYNLRLQRDNKFVIKDADAFYDMMDEFCQHISRKERNADQAERDADEFEMIKYMKNHLGEKFNAHITYVNSKVMFVKTEEGITGRLYPEDIQGDRFNYNDNTLSFNGKKSKKKLRIGTKLVLTALEADRDFGSISFGIDQEDFALIKSRKKGA